MSKEQSDTRTEWDSWNLAKHYLEPVKELLELDDISEIMINRFDEIFVERRGEMTRVNAKFESEDRLTTAIIQIGNALNQPVDARNNPILDARLPDGSRVCGVLFPNSTRGSSMSIRVFPKKRLTAEGLVERGSLNAAMIRYLKIAVIVRSNMLVSGGTASGKTTILNILSTYIPHHERVLTAEDTKELQLDLPNRVFLEAPHRMRDPGTTAQHIDMAQLIRTTLRMNPTRIFVGEIRDQNAGVAFLQAINTGHNGTCSTIHANNAADALVRMQTLVAGGGGSLPYEVVQAQVRRNLHVLIHVENTPRHGRRVVEIGELRGGELHVLWTWDYVNGVHVEDTAALANSVVMKNGQKYGIEIGAL
jgi:pilus assembly protein CpaF